VCVTTYTHLLQKALDYTCGQTTCMKFIAAPLTDNVHLHACAYHISHTATLSLQNDKQRVSLAYTQCLLINYAVSG
jgi:hypothetical protein